MRFAICSLNLMRPYVGWLRRRLLAGVAVELLSSFARSARSFVRSLAQLLQMAHPHNTYTHTHTHTNSVAAAGAKLTDTERGRETHTHAHTHTHNCGRRALQSKPAADEAEGCVRLARRSPSPLLAALLAG